MNIAGSSGRHATAVGISMSTTVSRSSGTSANDSFGGGGSSGNVVVVVVVEVVEVAEGVEVAPSVVGIADTGVVVGSVSGGSSSVDGRVSAGGSVVVLRRARVLTGAGVGATVPVVRSAG
jgi:hypothetical protein